MRILMLCELYIENLEYQENLLVKYYRKYGHEVTVITSTYENVFDYYNNIHDNNKKGKITYDYGAKIIKLPFKYNVLGKVKKYTNISKIVDEFQPDLLYVHDIMPNMFEMLNYKKRNPHVKMIMDFHADYSNSASNWLSLNILHKVIKKYFYVRPIKKHISCFFPIIPGSEVFLNEVYGISYKQMSLLPLGADVDRVHDIKKSGIREKIRRIYGINENDFVIFTGGKFTPVKKNHLVIEAINELADSNIHLIIVGDADEFNKSYKEHLYTLANNNKNVHFTGWLDNQGVYEHLAASETAVFPASQSIVWLQALASGLPLVVGDTGGQSLDYLNEFSAILEMKSEEISTKVIKEHIIRLKTDSKFYLDMKSATEETTTKFLDWNYLINKTLQFNTKSS